MVRISRSVSMCASLLLVCSVLSLASDSTFTSPTGRFTVRFKQLVHTKVAKVTSLDDNSFIKYQLFFTDVRSHVVRTAQYTDVYSSYAYVYNKGKPASLSRIVAQIIWSPSDQFAMLPEEAWPSAPGAPWHNVINLDSRFKWQSSGVNFDPFTWLDSITVAGNNHNDCSYCVCVFDGRSGNLITIKEGESPIGYSIDAMRDGKLVVKTILDNCSSEKDRRGFRPTEILFTRGEINRLLRKKMSILR